MAIRKESIDILPQSLQTILTCFVVDEPSSVPVLI